VRRVEEEHKLAVAAAVTAAKRDHDAALAALETHWQEKEVGEEARGGGIVWWERRGGVSREEGPARFDHGGGGDRRRGGSLS
jgi:hypothetical protein